MAGKEESFSLKPCSGARRVAEEEEDALVTCNGGSAHRDGSKNLGAFSLKPCTTTGTAAAVAFTGKEFQLKQRTTQSTICSTKRKVPTDGHDDEYTVVLADSETTDIKVTGAHSEVDSSDDDDEPVSEAEFAAFYEELKADHEKLYVERVLPLRLKNAKATQRLLQLQEQCEG